jgi:ribosomal protein S18 acetylase RimI-like enzyme
VTIKSAPAATPAALRPMTTAEYDAWREHSLATYARERAEAEGRPVAETMPEEEADFASLLPQGQHTPGHQFFHVLDSDTVVGWLWVGPHPNRRDAAWVYDIEIEASARGRGLGRATMLAAEGVAVAAGATELGLNVFAVNETAKSLYRSLGYTVTSMRMSKPLHRD